MGDAAAFFICLTGTLQLFALPLLVLALVLTLTMRRRVAELEKDAMDHEGRLSDLAAEVRALRDRLATLAARGPAAAEPAADQPAADQPAAPQPVPVDVPAPASAAIATAPGAAVPREGPPTEGEGPPATLAPEGEEPATMAAPAPAEPAAALETTPAPVPPAAPAIPVAAMAATPPATEPAAVAAPPGEAAMPPGPARPGAFDFRFEDAAAGKKDRPSGATPPPKKPATTPPPPKPPRPPRPPIDLEALGARLFSWIAGLALLLGAVFFLKLAVDQGWIGPPLRMAIGIVVGTSLLVLCELPVARRYAVTANAMLASGIAILFATLYASHVLWSLLPQTPTFALMALVTATAVLLSLRHDALFIALLGLLGGFGTPALLSSGQDRPVGLFGYLLLLNVGLAWVAHRKQWPALTAASLVFTVLYQWSWVLRFLDGARVPLAMGIFLAFPVVSTAGLFLSERWRGGAAPHPVFRLGAMLEATVPLLLAAYLAAVPAYGERHALLLSFVLLLSAALLLLSLGHRDETLHLVGGLGAIATFAIYFAMSYRATAYPSVLGFIAAAVLLYLLAPTAAGMLGRPFTGAGKASPVIAGFLLFTFPAILMRERAAAEPGLVFGTLFGLALALAARAVLHGDGAPHHAGALFSIMAQAVWSARHLTPERLLPGLAIYAGFALLYLAVPFVAKHLGHPLRGNAGVALSGLASLGLLFFLAAGTMAPSAFWGLAILLVVVNAGLLANGAAGRWAVAPLAGLAVSWLIVGVWWWSAPLSVESLGSALALVTGLALMAVVGGLAASNVREKETGRPGAMGLGPWLSLAGYAFILLVAVQPSLSVPPWPIAGVLGVLALGSGAAMLASRRPALHAVSLLASLTVILAWAAAVHQPSWGAVALLFTWAVVGLALLFEALGRRRGIVSPDLPATTVAVVLMAQVIGIAITVLPGTPHLPEVAAHVLATTVLLLALAWRQRWHWLATLAALPASFACYVWEQEHGHEGLWWHRLLYYGAVYACFQVSTFALGTRAGKSVFPLLGAVLASAAFFFLGQDCLKAGRLEGIIGILPVGEAAVAALLLWRLLQLEPPAERSMGRISLAAGTALAFVTVAIPLQLEKEWITIGWALQAAALAWLYGRLRHRGLFHFSWALAAAVMVRLCVNPAVLSYHPRQAVPILNWYLYTYLLAAAALYVQARLLSRADDVLGDGIPVRISPALVAGATLLLFLLLNIEIADFYSRPSGPGTMDATTTLTFNFNADIAQDLTYTIGWALFAIGMLVAGIATGSRATRLSSLLLLSVTIFKGFLHDFRTLSGLYRVGSFVGLAVCLALVAILLQRFVLRKDPGRTP